jgi:Na+-transporting NADH:ubiquinone oxidoreductase subunit C
MNSSKWNILNKDFFLKSVGVYCLSLFVVFSVFTQYFQCRTESVSRHRAVLETMGVLKPWRVFLGWQIQSMYKKKVREVWINDESGQLFWKRKPHTYPLYIVGTSAKTVTHYAFPFSFEGAYGPIEGVVALKGDGATVSGLQITREQELGLGSKCGWRWFGKQFRGKRIADSNGRFVGVTVVNGNMEEKVPASDVVQTIQGISGALQTNAKLEAGLEATFKRYEVFSKRLREVSK